MSATEIINIIKTINDRVTVKYCDAIIVYLNDKANDHLKFERDFFNSMDKAVQKLINAITASLNESTTNITLDQIQMHCDTYNKWKKTVYDDHLRAMQQMEKKCNQFVQQMLKEKLFEQHNLFDTALPIPLPPDTNSNNINIDMNMENISNIKQIASNFNNDRIFNDNTTNSTIFSNDNFEQTPETNLHLKMPNFSTLNCNKNKDSKRFIKQQTKRTNSKLIPVAPPKPPPPSTPDDDDESNGSGCNQPYQCIKCDKQFESQLQWLSHLKSHQKNIKSKKKQRKRIFSQTDFETDQLPTNKINKRRRHRFQCEYCDKRYFRSVPFIKHYNNHMKNNEHNICNFCGAQFQTDVHLEEHIYEFNAGLSLDDGYYQCCQCHMKFKEKLQLNSHLKRKHKRKQK